MNELWQHIAALGIVTLAVGYLLRQAWRLLAAKPASACGGCSGCAARKGAGLTLVAIRPPALRPPSDSGSSHQGRSTK